MQALLRFGQWLGRVWRSGIWVKVGIGMASLVLLGAITPRQPQSAGPAMPAPRPIPLGLIAVAAPSRSAPHQRLKQRSTFGPGETRISVPCAGPAATLYWGITFNSLLSHQRLAFSGPLVV
jgi:hypothetical protein